MADNLGIPIPKIRGHQGILAIQPHYDDNEISAGGTLAALVASGAELYYLTMSDDLVGVINDEWSAEGSARRLRDDQRRADEIMGMIGSEVLGYPDAGRYDYFDVRRNMIRAIRQVRPDILFTMDPWMAYEAHNDHLMASRAAARGRRDHTSLGIMLVLPASQGRWQMRESGKATHPHSPPAR